MDKEFFFTSPSKPSNKAINFVMEVSSGKVAEITLCGIHIKAVEVDKLHTIWYDAGKGIKVTDSGSFVDWVYSLDERDDEE